MDTNTRIHPETGEILHRDVRPHEFSYKGEKLTVDLPGWYPDDNDNGVLSHEDAQITVEVLKILKERVRQRELAVKTA